MGGSGLPGALLDHARSSIAAADASVPLAGPLAGQLSDVAQRSFTSAMTGGMAVAGAVAVLGAVLIAIALPARIKTVVPAHAGLAAEPELAPAS